MSLEILHPQWQKPIRGVLFDMDGLILDTERLYTRFWQEAARALGYPMNRDQALGMRSLNRDTAKKQMESYFGPETDYEAIRELRIRLMDAFIAENGVEAKPGIYELLDALDEHGIPAAVTTSSSLERARDNLTKLNIFSRFARICQGSDVPTCKPEPEIYLYGAASLGLPPENCLALEDSPAGILSACRAGCMPIMVPDQDQPDETTRRNLFAKADSLADVISLL